MKYTSIGGQGVLEGVMMRSPEQTAIAVRQEPGNIVTQKQPTKMLGSKHKILRVPIIRGVVNFVEMLFLGVKTITDAAKLYDPLADLDEAGRAEAQRETGAPAEGGAAAAQAAEARAEQQDSTEKNGKSKKEGKSDLDSAMFVAVVVAILLAVGLFFVLPNIITNWVTIYIEQPILKNLVDGGVRIGIFLAYVAAISSMKDIKRLFGYHGAEHKVINCYEKEQPLDVEHARECSRLHPRCGTSFLLIVMIISILLFSLLGWNENPFVRIGLRLAMLPVVAGVSYEVLKLVAKYENGFTRALRKPGMALQRFTTREPDDGMIEVALVSFLLAEDEMTDSDVEALAAKYSRVVPEGERYEDKTAEAIAKDL